MTNPLPCLVQLSRIPESEFVPNCEANFAAFKLWKCEPSNAFLIQTKIPSNSDVGLCLTLFETFVIVCFDLDQRTEDVLVLISVFVSARIVI